MINLLSAFWQNDHPIKLNQEFCLDLYWWREFVHSWNGLSFLLYPNWAPLSDFSVSSDAAGAQSYCTLFEHERFCSSNNLHHQEPGEGPLFIYQDGRPLSAAKQGIPSHLNKTMGR